MDGQPTTIWKGTEPLIYSFSIEVPDHPPTWHSNTLEDAWKYRLSVTGAEGSYKNSVPEITFLSETKPGVIRDIAGYMDLSLNERDRQFGNLPKINPNNIEIIDHTEGASFRDMDINAIYASATQIADAQPPLGEPVYIIGITQDPNDGLYNVKIIYANGFLDLSGLVTSEQTLNEGIDKFSKISVQLVPVAIARYMITTGQRNDIVPNPVNTKIINYTNNPSFTVEQVANVIRSMAPPQMQAPLMAMQGTQGNMQAVPVKQIEVAYNKGETLEKKEKVEEAPQSEEKEKRKEEAKTEWFEFYKPKYGFESVIGTEYAKKYFHDNIILGLEKPELFAKYKKSIHDGFMLYGPPGIGKTYKVAALAKETNANLLVVHLHQLLDQYVGNTEKNIHKLFEQARKNTPSIILFDEIDGLGASRNLGRQHGNPSSTLALHQLLIEMSSLESENENVVVVGTTNAPEDVDSALLRSGRFTNLLYIRPPDKDDRAKLFEFYTEGIPKRKLDYELLGSESKNLSPADISAVVKAAVTPLIAEAAKTGESKDLNTDNLLSAIRSRRASGSTMIKWYENMDKALKKGEFSAEDKLLYGEMIKDIKNRVKAPVKRKQKRKVAEALPMKKRLHS